MSKRDILVVFDIDETLIQFVNKNAYHYWKEVTPEQKALIDEKLEYEDLGDVKKQVIFLRPGLGEFLKMANETGRIKVAIWTYSEREYAEAIAELICNKFKLPDDIFIFKYGSEDIEDHDIPKSLKQIWDNPKFGKKFNKFNTFLVDDRYGNLCHEINVNNSILVQAFAPFGESKQREPLTDKLLEKAIHDPVFAELTNITNNLIRDIDGCEDEEIEDAFKKEAVFAPKCIERKRLDSYVRDYANNIQMCTIGEVDNAEDPNKGGRRGRRLTRKSGRRSRHKSGRKSAYKKYKGYRKSTKKYKMNKMTKKRRF
jgi:hypothetical protein